MTVKLSRMAFLLVVAGFVAAGCASSGERVGSSTSTTLSQEDMAQVPGATLYEIVDRLRPRWLQVRHTMSMSGTPGQIVVFMNNSYLGGPDMLRQFQASDVIEVRYLDGPQASAQLRGYDSTVHVVGAIVMVTSQR
ncbi:MAG TPA: hypothetical protein VK929_05660 [Longimicrobiales bacterium]|nr:hypothetical protein [Longimicrobiales bacterium]